MLTALTVATALALSPAAAAVDTPAPVPPPSIAQICLATGIAQVDDALDGVAKSDLVGSLASLLKITVPKGADTVELDASLQLAQIKKKLNCAVATATATPTETATATPVPTTTPAPVDDGVGGDDNGGVSRIPTIAPETGGTPPTSPLEGMLVGLFGPLAALAILAIRRRRHS